MRAHFYLAYSMILLICGLVAFCQAAGTKTGGIYQISDDLTTGSAGSVGLSGILGTQLILTTMI